MALQKNHLITFIILILVPIGQIGVDLYTPSLPAITQALHTTNTLVQLTLSFYLIGFSIGQLLSGILSDSYGRKKILLIGIFLYALCSLIAGITSSIFILLVMRLLQGLGATACSVLSKSIASDCFKDLQLMKLSSYMMVVWGLSPIIAPAIGGYIQHYLGWRFNFYFFTVYSVISFILVAVWLEETNKNKVKIKFKKLIENFALILKHKEFVASFFGMSTAYSILITFSLIAPFLIQDELGFSAIVYGHMALLIGVAWFLGSFSNRYLITRFKTNSIVYTGSILIALISTLLLLFSLFKTISLFILILPTFLIVFLIGTFYPSLMANCMKLFTEIAGTANSIMGFFVIFLSSLVSIFVSLLHITTLSNLAIIYLTLALLGLIVFRFNTNSIN